MSEVALLPLMLNAEPAALERAQRVAYAVRLVRRGASRPDVIRSLTIQFAVSRKTAYRISSIAFDIAGFI